MKGIPYETQLEKTLQEMREENGGQIHTLDNHITTETDMEMDEVLCVAEDDLQTYNEAKQAHDVEKWETSYDDELKSMHRHNVWTLVP